MLKVINKTWKLFSVSHLFSFCLRYKKFPPPTSAPRNTHYARLKPQAQIFKNAISGTLTPTLILYTHALKEFQPLRIREKTHTRWLFYIDLNFHEAGFSLWDRALKESRLMIYLLKACTSCNEMFYRRKFLINKLEIPLAAKADKNRLSIINLRLHSAKMS